jgi:acetyl esterase/lipase
MSRWRELRRLARAQRQAAHLLVATLRVPGADALGRFGVAPQIDEEQLAGVPTTIVRPAGAPPWPAFLFANGATPDGRAHPVVRRLALALARSGYATFIPDLPGISGGELTPATLAAAVECAQEIADSPETKDGRVGLVGVSVGATLALLVAADERLASRVSLVTCIAPFTDLRKVMMLATTGTYRDGAGVSSAYPTPPSLVVGLARSIAAMLPTTPAASGFVSTLRALDVTSDDPLAPVRRGPSDPIDHATNSVRDLLVNRDPARFDDLHDALPKEIRSTIELLSPVCVATHIRAPIEIATAPRDRYFPVAESLALAGAQRAHVTITPALAHAKPRLDMDSLNGLAQLSGFFVRSLVAAEAVHPVVTATA